MLGLSVGMQSGNVFAVIWQTRPIRGRGGGGDKKREKMIVSRWTCEMKKKGRRVVRWSVKSKRAEDAIVKWINFKGNIWMIIIEWIEINRSEK